MTIHDSTCHASMSTQTAAATATTAARTAISVRGRTTTSRAGARSASWVRVGGSLSLGELIGLEVGNERSFHTHPAHFPLSLVTRSMLGA
jgi:hypothetical protein